MTLDIQPELVKQISPEFIQAVQKLQQNQDNWDRTILLELYALVKQATQGDVNVEQPGMFQVKDGYRYNAWKSVKGKSQQEAITKFLQLISNL